MKKETTIILADSPILNPTIIKPISNLSVSYHIYLHSLLYSNWLELLAAFKDHFNIIGVLNEKDKEYLPKDFFLSEFQNLFYGRQKLKELINEILVQPSIEDSKILIIFHNSIGFKASDIERYFNLVQTDEASVVIAKSNRNKILAACTYNPEKEFIDQLINSERDYNKFLNYIGSKDVFIHTIEGFLSIDDFEDIKKLYIELSKKESLSYCNQKMHESFNDLFVEYKELLNV
jgi:hypothetical protein